MNDRELLLRAVAMSAHGIRERAGGPFGAVVARQGEVVAEGWNRVTSTNDPTAHAEVVAIRAAAVEMNTYDLSGCILYSSCEPCPMCLAAAYWSRVDRVFYANTRADAAAIGFDDRLIYDELSKSEGERSLPMIRLDVEEAAAVLREWNADPDKLRY